MKVDKAQFTAVVDRLLNSPPIKRADAKTGQRKTGQIIPTPKPR